jgi:large-conductance mechanosensitive channel
MRKHRFITFGFGLLGLVGAFTILLQPVPAFADLSTGESKNAACAGIGGTTPDGKCKVDGPSLNNIIATVVNILSVVVGIVAVIMIIVGGFNFITAAGDSSKVSTAKNTIIYAVVGLVIVALAQFIVQFVIDNTETTKKEEDEKKKATLVERV